MNGQEFRDSLAALRTTQAQISKLFAVNPRTVRRWYSGSQKVPKVVELWLTYMKAHALTPAKLTYELERFGDMAWLLMDDARKDRPVVLKLEDKERPVVGWWEPVLGRWLYDGGGIEIEARGIVGWSPIPV